MEALIVALIGATGALLAAIISGIYSNRKINKELNMAGGNVNDRQEAFLTRVTYTIAEYGVTIPGETDVDIGDVIDGQPTTPVIGQK